MWIIIWFAPLHLYCVWPATYRQNVAIHQLNYKNSSLFFYVVILLYVIGKLFKPTNF